MSTGQEAARKQFLTWGYFSVRLAARIDEYLFLSAESRLRLLHDRRASRLAGIVSFKPKGRMRSHSNPGFRVSCSADASNGRERDIFLYVLPANRSTRFESTVHRGNKRSSAPWRNRGCSARQPFDCSPHLSPGGDIAVQGERMWVIVSERYGDFYIGILDNQPASIEPSDTVYLCFGAEVPFLPEHVIDIGEPPKEYIEWQLGQEPEHRWPRE